MGFGRAERERAAPAITLLWAQRGGADGVGEKRKKKKRNREGEHFILSCLGGGVWCLRVENRIYNELKTKTEKYQKD